MATTIVAGYITEDPHLDLSRNGKPSITFTVKNDRDQSDCIAFGQTASALHASVRKGDQVKLIGRTTALDQDAAAERTFNVLAWLVLAPRHYTPTIPAWRRPYLAARSFTGAGLSTHGGTFSANVHRYRDQ